MRDKWTKRETTSSAGFVLSSLRDADTAGTHGAVHVCVQSDSGSRKRQIPLLSQHYLIAMFLQPTHDRTRAAKNRRPFFFPLVLLPPHPGPRRVGGGHVRIRFGSPPDFRHAPLLFGAPRDRCLAAFLPSLFATETAQTVNCRFHGATCPGMFRRISSFPKWLEPRFAPGN